jgi:hypothetical protein
MEAELVWAGILLAGAAFEGYTLANGHDGDTLSETTRRAFRTRTKTGALVFGATWMSFSTWFLGHILWGWPFPLT